MAGLCYLRAPSWAALLDLTSPSTPTLGTTRPLPPVPSLSLGSRARGSFWDQTRPGTYGFETRGPGPDVPLPRTLLLSSLHTQVNVLPPPGVAPGDSFLCLRLPDPTPVLDGFGSQ